MEFRWPSVRCYRVSLRVIIKRKENEKKPSAEIFRNLRKLCYKIEEIINLSEKPLKKSAEYGENIVLTDEVFTLIKSIW